MSSKKKEKTEIVEKTEAEEKPTEEKIKKQICKNCYFLRQLTETNGTCLRDRPEKKNINDTCNYFNPDEKRPSYYYPPKPRAKTLTCIYCHRQFELICPLCSKPQPPEEK